MKKFIEHNFGFFLVVATLIGYFWPKYFLFLGDYADKFLMFALFLGFLKIDFSELKHLKQNSLKLLGYVFLYLIIVPMFVLGLSFWIPESIRQGIFLISAASSAIICALLSGFLQLKSLWATAFVVLSSFFVPISLPLLIRLCLDMEVEIAFWQMVGFLAQVIFIPGILAFIFRNYLSRPTRFFTNNSGFLGTGCMSVFIITLIAPHQALLEAQLWTRFSAVALGTLGVLFVFLFLLGYKLPAENMKERLTNALLFGNMNNGLVILLALEFFPAEVFLVTLLSEIPWVIAQSPFSRFVLWKQHHEKFA